MTVSSKLFRAFACAGVLSVLSTPAWAVADFTLRRDLDTRSESTCTSETAFGNLVADAARKIYTADVALIPCTAISGNRNHAKGESFDATAASAEIALAAQVVQIEVSGQQLLETLEQALASAPAASNTFLQVAGIRMEVNLTKPAGQRIVKLTSNGAALDFTRTYRVATTADAAKAFASLAGAKKVEGQPSALGADVATHLQAVGVRDIKVLGRIKFTR